MEAINSKPIELLDNKLSELIDKNIDNLDLKKKLIEEYLKNNLTPSIINSLFAGEKYVNLLGDKEKVMLLRGMKKYFKSIDLKEEEYFSKNIINRIDNDLGNIKYEHINEIKIKNLLSIDSEAYTGVMSYEDIYKYMEENLFIYEMDLQREGTYIRFSNGYIKVPTLDQKSIDNIVQHMENNTLETGAITLGYLLKPDTIPEFTIDSISEVLFDITAKNMLVIDGMHRLVALTRYCSKLLAEGKEFPKKNMMVKIVIGDKVKLRNTVNQSFLQSNVSKEYLKAITDDDYSRFIDRVIEQSDVLKDNVATTFEECKFLNKDTTKDILRKAVEKLDIGVNNKATALFESKAVSENLDILIQMLKENNCYLNYYNMYLPYTIFAYNINKKNNDFKYYEEFMNKLKGIGKEEVKELKLGLKNYNINKLVEYFNVFEV